MMLFGLNDNSFMYVVFLLLNAENVGVVISVSF